MPRQFGFNKTEKLKSRKQIDELFTGGKSLTAHPVRLSYRIFPSGESMVLQAGVSVGKKHFKKAVDRNRIKRQLREAYRLQKGELATALKTGGKSAYLFFIFTAPTLLPYDVIYQAVGQCLKRVQKMI